MRGLMFFSDVRRQRSYASRFISLVSSGIRYGVVGSVLTMVLLAGCAQESVSTATYNNEIPKTLLLSREAVLATLADLGQVHESLKKDSKNAQLYFQAGLLEERLERWDNALRDFQMAIRRDSKLHEAYYHSGYVAEKIGESYELDPNQKAEGRTVKGPMRRYALDMYRNAVKLKPNYADALHRLCLAYVLSNDLPRSLDVYQRLKELEPGTNRTKELLSRVYDLQRAQNQKN